MNTATFLFGMSNHSEATTVPFRCEIPRGNSAALMVESVHELLWCDNAKESL